ncbi:MAG: hypothetical protein M3O06_10660, partial [Pseudomonadota bacterium]|nr:hypothetical protein [Pseudomonadota bacterium]
MGIPGGLTGRDEMKSNDGILPQVSFVRFRFILLFLSTMSIDKTGRTSRRHFVQLATGSAFALAHGLLPLPARAAP